MIIEPALSSVVGVLIHDTLLILRQWWCVHEDIVCLNLTMQKTIVLEAHRKLCCSKAVL